MNIVDQILQLPQAYLIIQQIEASLEAESKKRTAFYDKLTEQEKAEFINGEMVIHSPVRREHNEVNGQLYHLLDVFVKKHQLGFVGVEKIMISLTRNDYEPDICFFRKDKADHFQKGQTLFPAPDLVVEVLSSSTAQRDRGIKFTDYEAHGVEEYWIIDVDTFSVEQYHLEKGKYKLISKSTDGNISSFVISNFSIPVQAVFDPQENLKALSLFLSPNT